MDENHERQRLCPRCGTLTRYERHPWDTVWMFLTALMPIFCLWPVTLPLMLVVWVAERCRPYRCCICGRRSWGGGGKPGHYPDFAEPESADEVTDSHDLIRLVRRATVGSEGELVKPVERIVRAIEAEGQVFRLYGHSPAFRLHRAKRVWRWVSTSEIQWNFGRGSQDPTHEVIFYGIHKDAPRCVYLRIRWVQTGTDATRPGLDLLLRVPASVPSLKATRAARLDRLFTKLVEAIRPDFGHITLHDDSDESAVNPAPVAGWLTYLADRRPLTLPPGAVATPLAGGVKITLAPGPVPEKPEEIADAVAAVQQAIAPDPP